MSFVAPGGPSSWRPFCLWIWGPTQGYWTTRSWGPRKATCYNPQLLQSSPSILTRASSQGTKTCMLPAHLIHSNSTKYILAKLWTIDVLSRKKSPILVVPKSKIRRAYVKYRVASWDNACTSPNSFDWNVNLASESLAKDSKHKQNVQCELAHQEQASIARKRKKEKNVEEWSGLFVNVNAKDRCVW